ncbi:L-aspartate oxidase [uncultured Fusobacterium sp.]|uniref:L-aspartate oxidase n=1 Tax=uncultured Fusobacterium sp. TaxID=159267 RepID=UPI0026007F2B|nr:L-aspartate oxidase [uncultured Fusobacterium sp.]
MNRNYDVIIAGTGAGGCFTALHLPEDMSILMITKSTLEESDSFLAQGGICVLRDENDFDSFFEDTLKAGHYKNKKESVEIMINSSRDTINQLINYDVDFATKNGEMLYTREGAHSKPRIAYHDDITGQEITQKLLSHVLKKKNITLLTNTTLLDIISDNNKCVGGIVESDDGKVQAVYCKNLVLATGGLGGVYEHSTNFPHLTGDALAIAAEHNIKLKDISYIQIHPTTLFTKEKGRSFLVSESVRGEGALLYDKNFQRFTDELIPRDRLTAAIRKQMTKDNTEFVWLDMRPIIEKGIDITKRFPNIVKKCREEGYDPEKECIPVVPAQHYFMGGIDVNLNSKTSMEHLYAVGETSCNGVHGANRLASNSLLETLVFGERAAHDIVAHKDEVTNIDYNIDLGKYNDKKTLFEKYRSIVLEEIEKDRGEKERA